MDQFCIKLSAVIQEARKYQMAPDDLQKWHIAVQQVLEFMKRLGLLVDITDKKLVL